VVGLIAILVGKIKKQGKWNINPVEEKKVKKEQSIHLVDLLHQNVKILVKEKNGAKLNETLH
jgi:predicted nucleic acid-binding protein